MEGYKESFTVPDFVPKGSEVSSITHNADNTVVASLKDGSTIKNDPVKGEVTTKLADGTTTVQKYTPSTDPKVAAEQSKAVSDSPGGPNITPNSEASQVTGANLADQLAKLNPAQLAAYEKLTKDKSVLAQIKSNPKLTGLGIGVSAVALYMIIHNESNPAQAVGELAGQAGSGAASGLLDGLGLGPLTSYLPYMSLGCSCFLFMFMFLYMFKTFLH